MQQHQAMAAEGREGHFNEITQRWETPDERPEIAASQAASTMPDSDGHDASKGPSFTQQVNGFAKRFAGKLTGKEHEVAMGDALLDGKNVDQARATAEAVKMDQQAQR
ncbi:hypothetical protein BMF94_2712 [Rhodotorula taiwanensis]|uniref:Uncharacterized protein n=1 Tax=Rhodotorula taiwanensis TaxID=741276 RepID=A0A2S5BBX2_9BASI|nr:hypothetical protein BMF94_2712 [Rhodotorula taiwanensis]